MFDETNRTEEQDFTLPDNLFEDAEIENESFESQNQGEEKTETIRIKYNGEERDITLDEARVLAQKGMNYDHVLSERDTKYRRELDFLDKVAAGQGMTRAEYMNMHESGKKESANAEESTAQNVTERAREQIRRISDSVGFTGPWSTLFNKYPELTREGAYSLLSEKVKSGLSPLEAYQENLLAEKERELTIARNNSEARKRSVGSLEGDGEAFVHDDFLEGFAAID